MSAEDRPKDPDSGDLNSQTAPDDRDAAADLDLTPTIDAISPSDARAEQRAENDASNPTPARIGPYLLVRRLGEGGMGQVWLAQQSVPVKRQVALKLIRAGMYDDSLLQRFRAERQSLAMMDHPAIAKVFDAGATADGQPYFVMEYVRGVPITTYCDEHKLTIRQRLELFMKVCEGVQHAHQKAIIHRDLKPANILAVEIDGKAMPRIIDFGLAKAVTAGGADETMVTRFGGFVGTPGYMSPEQADSSVGDVDTRTDVYSLGVVLYLLLTGALPFDSEKLKKKSMVEIVRELHEVDPPSPSVKVESDAKTAGENAERRATDARQLARQLRGDLDWIVMKALEKERGRRYGTPSEMAADIARYLNHEPVIARPASPGYKLQKYARRHWIGVSVAAGLALLLIGFAGLQAVQLRRIARERDRANRITDFMMGMFQVSDPSQSRGNTVTAREILDKASRNIESGLSRDPEMQAQLMGVMGDVYMGLGLYGQSETLLRRSLEIQQRVLGKDRAVTLKTQNELAVTLDKAGKRDEAEAMIRDDYERSRKAFGPKDPMTIKALGNLGAVLTDEGKFTEAEKALRDALGVAEQVIGAGAPDTRKYRFNLALVLGDLGELAEAEKVTREELEHDQATLGADHPETLDAMNNLAALLSDDGKPAEAEKIEHELVATQLRVHGPEHPDTLRAIDNLAGHISDQGRYEEAEKMQREALELERRVLGAENAETLANMGNLVNTLAGERRYAEAEALEEETIAITRKLYGAESPDVAVNVYNMACLKAEQGKKDEALAELRRSVEHGLPPRMDLTIADDEDLKSLHGDPRFDAILAEARAKVAEARKQR
jgi:serine/threonine protein kinase